MARFRIIVAIANQYGLMLHHMDVKTAFLNGTLGEEIYMQVPEGIKVTKTNQVCKLNKAIYGLKQSGTLLVRNTRQSVEEIRVRKLSKRPMHLFSQRKVD